MPRRAGRAKATAPISTATAHSAAASRGAKARRGGDAFSRAARRRAVSVGLPVLISAAVLRIRLSPDGGLLRGRRLAVHGILRIIGILRALHAFAGAALAGLTFVRETHLLSGWT